MATKPKNSPTKPWRLRRSVTSFELEEAIRATKGKRLDHLHWQDLRSDDDNPGGWVWRGQFFSFTDAEGMPFHRGTTFKIRVNAGRMGRYPVSREVLDAFLAELAQAIIEKIGS